ncbi:hypothetical protein GE09DRAFT_1079026 [Coniochaeta sp. 2T2.1]|nr:hypothetical protein GE09DRAFT_1079026 [Coniochaeta sp. 2T2.1]
MKPTTVLLALLPLSLAAPVAEGNTAAEAAADKRQYGDYGSYPPPAGGYGSYGSYAGAGAGTPAATPAGGYGSYGSYPPPPGGYASYGTYKRAVGDFMRKIFG